MSRLINSSGSSNMIHEMRLSDTKKKFLMIYEVENTLDVRSKRRLHNEITGVVSRSINRFHLTEFSNFCPAGIENTNRLAI